jgi:hypothetical protein
MLGEPHFGQNFTPRGLALVLIFLASSIQDQTRARKHWKNIPAMTIKT